MDLVAEGQSKAHFDVNDDGKGIDLIAQGQSGAKFDINNTGAAVKVGWVGPTSGILVFDPTGGPVTSASQIFGQDFNGGHFGAGSSSAGFTALASLAQAGAAVFSAATSRVDAATGKLYFNELEVWVDANGNGATDPGELHSLAAASANLDPNSGTWAASDIEEWKCAA